MKKIEDPLLAAVWPEDAALRAETCAQVVRLARRRRRGRARRRGLGVAAALALAAFLWRGAAGAGGGEFAGAAGPEGVTLVRSAPLAAGEMFATQGPGAAGAAGFAPVGSSFAGLALVGTRPLDLRVVETRLAMPAVDFLDDRELLAAFPGQRAALIDAGTPRARLIFY